MKILIKILLFPVIVPIAIAGFFTALSMIKWNHSDESEEYLEENVEILR